MLDADRMSEWAYSQYLDKYAWKDEAGNPIEKHFGETATRVTTHVMGALGYTPSDLAFKRVNRYISQRKFIPGGRYLAMTGRPIHQVNNCFLFKAQDSREGWADIVSRSVLALSSGGGIGVVWSDVRPNGSLIKKTGGVATGPVSPASMVNEVARHVIAGGSRRSAIWGGLHWNHKDIFDWITVKDWTESQKAAKAEDYNAPAPLDMTNISVILDDDFFTAYNDPMHRWHVVAQDVYWQTIRHMLKHGEPGFSIDVGSNAGENLRNACTEVCTSDDNDVCNLGSINLARVESKEELQDIVKYASLFLLAGTVYSDVPFDAVAETRSKNRRLGLGLMGIHEWLLSRGYDYQVTDELHEWLDIYAQSTEYACEWADQHHLSHPVKTRAIAPNGTISIVAETTSGIEPIFCVAYKRRFLYKGQWHYQYVIDPTTERLKQQYGVNPDDIEDAYTLAFMPEKRIKFQAEIQKYVDHGISSTINLPYPIVGDLEVEDFGRTLMHYLPELRGITVFPDGARSGQPLTVSTYEQAIGQVGVTFEEEMERCIGGVCGV